MDASTIQDSSASGASKASVKSAADKNSSIRLQSVSAPSNDNDDDFDDFDPRGTSNSSKPSSFCQFLG